jgi:hypothetical protein
MVSATIANLDAGAVDLPGKARGRDRYEPADRKDIQRCLHQMVGSGKGFAAALSN